MRARVIDGVRILANLLIFFIVNSLSMEMILIADVIN